MSWDPIWDEIFRARAWGRYPPEEVVRFLARNYGAAADRAAVTILEIGCGPGSGTSCLVAREGYRLSGLDGSAHAIELAKARFVQEGLQGEFVCGAAQSLPWRDECFDAVLDVGCLACNSQLESASIVTEIARVLKPGGRHFSITPRAGCWGDGTGERLDEVTRRNVIEGPFAGLGKVRFATEESLRTLYAAFRQVEVEWETRSAGEGRHEIRHWNVNCVK